MVSRIIIISFFFTQLTTNQFWGLFRGRTHGFSVREGVGKKQQNEAQSASEAGKRGDSCVPCALPSPSSPRLLRAHLSRSIKCQADHIDAPPSPQQSLISERTPTLQRTANSGGEAGDVLAASLRWLAERARHSSRPSACSHPCLRLLEVMHAAKNITLEAPVLCKSQSVFSNNNHMCLYLINNMRKIHPLLLFLAPLSGKCVQKHAVPEVSLL